MKTGFISVPYKAEKGVSEINGIAKFSPAGIIFEYESKLFGMIGGQVKEVRVALDDILDLRFRKGVFKLFAQIQIRLKSIVKQSELPNEGGKIKLKIKREDYEIARKAVEQIQRFMAGEPAILPEPDGESEPPPPTSVNELFDTEKLSGEDVKKTRKL